MTTTPPPTHSPGILDQYLTVEQRQRALAAHEARAVLRTNASAFSSRPIDVMDIVNLAQWIIDGEDPWDDAPTGGGANPEAAKVPDHGIGPFGIHIEPRYGQPANLPRGGRAG